MDHSLLIELLHTYKYWVLFPLALLEGPFLALVSGFFVSEGYFTFLPAYLILIVGNAVPDALYYFLGRYSRGSRLESFAARKIGLTKDRVKAVEHLWEKHTFKLMFLSKWALGITAPLLLLGGFSNITFKKYFFAAAVVSFVNYSILLTVGFYAGQSYALIAKYIEYGGILIAVTAVVAVLVYLRLMGRARQRMLVIIDSQKD